MLRSDEQAHIDQVVKQLNACRVVVDIQDCFTIMEEFHANAPSGGKLEEFLHQVEDVWRELNEESLRGVLENVFEELSEGEINDEEEEKKAKKLFALAADFKDRARRLLALYKKDTRPDFIPREIALANKRLVDTTSMLIDLCARLIENPGNAEY